MCVNLRLLSLWKLAFEVNATIIVLMCVLDVSQTMMVPVNQSNDGLM